MKKIILLLTLVTFLFPAINFGCSCGPLETFCETVESFNNYPVEVVIVRGEVISLTDEVTVKVNDQIYGKTTDSEIVVAPNMCTYYFQDLEVGGEYVFALYGSENSFSPPGCAVFFLEVNNEVVSGKIAEGVASINYRDLGTLENCGIVFDNFSLMDRVSIFPNPMTEEIKIENTDQTKPITGLALTIFDSVGKLIQHQIKETDLLPAEVWPTNIQDLPAGIYFVKLASDAEVETFKIVKQ